MKPLLAALLLAPLPAFACPAPSMQDTILRDALRHNGYRLDAWGLDAAGNMEELWRDEAGSWALVETTPGHCSTVISRPSKPMGRLVTPSNDADPMRMGEMGTGEGA